MNKGITLKRGREKPILNKHHWIFSLAIDNSPKFENGDLLPVYAYDGFLLGYGYFNNIPDAIKGRMISYGKSDPIETLQSNIRSAIVFRKNLFNEYTNCYRLINSEGDNIPGLTVDKYDKVLVIQVSTLGIEKLKEKIINILVDELDPDAIYEKSNMPARKHEGLENFEGYLYSKHSLRNDEIEVMENGIKFLINLPKSHKTGFYLDQREMRKLIGEMAKDKTLLNCFSYTGGFSVYAAKNGSKEVVSVDISAEVIEQAKKNFRINNVYPELHKFFAEDVFSYLENNEINQDIVILDPPAFAKEKADIPHALSGYRKLNRLALKKMKKNSFLLTCSCSYHVNEEEFLRVIGQAASDAKRKIKILQGHRNAMDHCLNIFHQEIDYLKSFLLFVE